MAAYTPAIQVAGLKKYYEVHEKEPGLKGSFRSFFWRQTRQVKAVDNVSFEIGRGEIVGFLGPNGAGKTTTLKCLSGLLYPTAGSAHVLGYTPSERRAPFLKAITLVMGQKNQLLWDLPAMESFLVNQAIYELPDHTFKQTLGELDELLDLGPLLHKQVRKLSLGERMKCELAAALLHQPQVLFLDEPTIGLDVTMQAKIRQFVAAYNQRHSATVILTSHYMADVTALAERIIVIDHGHIIYDGNLKALVEEMAPYKLVTIVAREPLQPEVLSPFGEIETFDTLKATLRVPRGQTSLMTARLLQAVPANDVEIADPPIEAIITALFAGNAPTRPSLNGAMPTPEAPQPPP